VVDTGSEFLDVVLALAFVYFLLSLICSGVAEAIAAALKLRARKLEQGIDELLASDAGGPADDLKAHPLVKRMARGRRKTPSYVSSRGFTLALLDTLAPRGNREGGINQALTKKLDELPESLRRQLGPLLDEAEGSVEQLRNSIEDWYDDAMERVSGWYKRQSQLITAGIAVIVVIGLNVSTVRVVDRLWNDDAVRSSVASAAVAAVEKESKQQRGAKGGGKEKGAAGAGANGRQRQGAASTDPLAQTKAAGKKVKKTTEDLAALNLPIGWGEHNRDVLNLVGIGGWLLSIVAVALGAPFWFDALSRLAPLRSTGPPPKGRRRRRSK
jgi:hypothetical protein